MPRNRRSAATRDAIFRLATVADVPVLLPLMAAFNAAEGIALAPSAVAGERLAADPGLGFILLAEASSVLGYGVVTFNYDLEFAGRDAFVTELYVVAAARRSGIGRGLLQALEAEARRRQVRALHLLVQPGNLLAKQLYRSAGFAPVPREMMTKPLD